MSWLQIIAEGQGSFTNDAKPSDYHDDPNDYPDLVDTNMDMSAYYNAEDKTETNVNSVTDFVSEYATNRQTHILDFGLGVMEELSNGVSGVRGAISNMVPQFGEVRHLTINRPPAGIGHDYLSDYGYDSNTSPLIDFTVTDGMTELGSFIEFIICSYLAVCFVMRSIETVSTGA